jgi:hypothetical protein
VNLRGNCCRPKNKLEDVLERLPTQPASRVEALLPHWWRPVG